VPLLHVCYLGCRLNRRRKRMKPGAKDENKKIRGAIGQTCSCHLTDPEKVPPEALEELEEMDSVELEDLAEFFQAFGDINRIRILSILGRGEICVSDLTEILGMTQSAVSHQLRNLKLNRLVKARREGKQILYSLDDGHVSSILEVGVHHIREGRP